MSIQLPTLQSYVATGGDPKSGTVMVTGPGNGWYTFSGTIAEEVRSEADGHIISGEDGPLHQFSVKIECATYGQPVATAAPTDCDFDKTMQHMLNPGNDLPKPPTVEEYAGQNGWTTEQLRDFFADFCGDKAFRNMAGLLDPQKAVGVDPAASALEYFLTRCNLIDNSSPEDNAKFIAADGQVSTADAQAEVQKLRSHGCPRK